MRHRRLNATASNLQKVHATSKRSSARPMWKSPKGILLGCVLALIGYGAWNLLGFGHSIANGSQIFAQVSGVRTAIPVNASNVNVQSSTASWIAGCSGIPGSRDGWTSDRVSISFTDLSPRNTVVRYIARSLKQMGWQRHDSSPGRGTGAIAHWTLDVRSAHVAQAWAFPVGPGTHHWYFSSSWRPPGPSGQGCP